MEAILKFNLPEEREDFEVHSKAWHYKLACESLDNYLRGRLKHEELPDSVHEALRAVRDRLHQELQED